MDLNRSFLTSLGDVQNRCNKNLYNHFRFSNIKIASSEKINRCTASSLNRLSRIQNDDLDQDGFVLSADCDDNNAKINPDATDIPNNGIDEN